MRDLDDLDRDLLARLALVEVITPLLAAVLAEDDDDPADDAVMAVAGQLDRLRASGAVVIDPGSGQTAVEPGLRSGALTQWERRPAMRRGLLARAAVWYEREGMLLLAIRCAADAGEWLFVGALLMRSVALLFAGRDREALLIELDRIPRHLAPSDPALAAALSALAFCRGQREAFRRELRVAVQAVRAAVAPVPPPTIAAVHILTAERALMDGQPEAMLMSARAAVEAVRMLDPATTPAWPIYVDVAETLAGHAELWAGSLERGVRMLADRRGVPQASEFVAVRADGFRAIGLVLLGEARSAALAAETALAPARALGWDDQPVTAPAWAASALAAADDERDEDARVALAALAPMREMGGVDPLVAVVADLAEIELLRRSSGEASARLRILAIDSEAARWRGSAERIAALQAALRPRPDAPTVVLTAREREVLALLPSLLTMAEIAARLYLSFHTVRQHAKSVYRKLGVSRRSDAVRVARERGLLIAGDGDDASPRSMSAP